MMTMPKEVKGVSQLPHVASGLLPIFLEIALNQAANTDSERTIRAPSNPSSRLLFIEMLRIATVGEQ